MTTHDSYLGEECDSLLAFGHLHLSEGTVKFPKLILILWWLLIFTVSDFTATDDYLLFIECSASMQGAKAEAAKAGAQLFLAKLDDDATFQVFACNSLPTANPRVRLSDEAVTDDAPHGYIGKPRFLVSQIAPPPIHLRDTL